MTYTSTLDVYAKKIIYVKVLGFRSITIINGKSITKPTDVLYLIGSISFGIFICFLSFLNKKEFDTSKSVIANYGNFAGYIASIFVSILTMCCCFVFRHRIWQMLVDLTNIEKRVRNIIFDQKMWNFKFYWKKCRMYLTKKIWHIWILMSFSSIISSQI